MAVGLLTSVNLPTDLAKKSYAGAIMRLAPNGSTPLTGLTALLKSETASGLEHGYYTKTMIFPSMTLTASAVAGDTTLTVNNTTDIVGGDLFRADTTGEIVIVNTVPSGTSVTVTRGVGTVAAGSIANGVVLYHIGNAFEQASIRPSAVALVATRYINYTQIIRNSWALSKTLAALPLIAGDGAVAESRRDAVLFHALALEKALFFGQKFQGTRNGQPFQTMEGIIARVMSAAPSNVTSLGSTTNWTQLEAALDPTLAVSSDVASSNIRTMFVGGVARRVIHNICRLNSNYQITSTETSWGLQIDTLRTPRGTFEIIEHRLFNAYGSSSTWAKMAVIVDLSAFALAYLRPTNHAAYNATGALVDNGIDAEGGTLTTEVTCLIKNPAAFGVIYNFTAAAAG